MKPTLKKIIEEFYPDIGDYQMSSVIALFEWLDKHGNNVNAINYTEHCLIKGLDRAVTINNDPNMAQWKTLEDKVMIAKHHILD